MAGTARNISVMTMYCLLALLLGGGCNSFGAKKNTGATVAGVTAPFERIAALQALREAAPSAKAEEKERICQKLSAEIRNEQDPVMRGEILRTLAAYGAASAWPVLQAGLSDPEADVRIIVCAAWGKRGDAEAVKLLSGALRSDADRDVRMAAARALGQSRDRAAVAALGTALEDPDPAMQYRAVASLRQVTHQDLGNDVEQWRAYVKNNGAKPAQSPTLIGRLFGGIN
jgi:HEAT repeat protein